MDAALIAFAVVFVAELGDKTQLVALGLAARYRLSVVLTGIGLAYVVTQGLAALLGGALGAALPTTAIGLGAAILFFAFAAWTFFDALAGDEGGAIGGDGVGGDGVGGIEEPGLDAAGVERVDEVGAPVDEAIVEAVAEVEAVAAHAGRGAVGIVAGIVGAMVLAELGDKSMLATATVAADRGALGAWVGATLGISAAGGLAVVVGRVLGARVPDRATRLVSAGLFVLFGVLLLADTLT